MVLKSIGKLFNNFLKSLENKYIGTVVSLFLVLFGGLAAPEIPNFVKKMLNNDLFRLVYAFLLTYIAEKNIQIALVAAVVFLVLNGLVANEEVKEAFEEAIEDIASGKNEKDTDNDYIDELYEKANEAEEKAVAAEGAKADNAEELRKEANEALKIAEEAESAQEEENEELEGNKEIENLDWDPDEE